MTITTEMLLAAGCEISGKSAVLGGHRGVFDVSGEYIGWIDTEGRFVTSQWSNLFPKPRFRVKAKSRPYIPATIFGPGDDGPEWVIGDRYIYTAKVPTPEDFTVFGGLAK